jgi:hypothetical protein
MKKYSKFIVAVVGLAAMFFGVPVVGVEVAAGEVVQGLLALATAFGVYQVSNEK